MNLLFELRFTLRLFRHNLSFNLLAMLVIALGLGVILTLFNLTNNFYGKSLPFKHGERYVRIAALDMSNLEASAGTGGRTGQRLEFRAAGADTNAYLVHACLLGMGAWGIEHQLEPLKPVLKSAYMRQSQLPKSIKFPSGLQQAIAAFRKSKVAKELFGRDFVEMFAGTRQAQLDALTDKRGRVSHAAEMRTFLAGI
ncbi:MAG: hypothetical protein ABGY96_26940 [bacterium]|nr:hypothetical protein [Gammaproteobacteria bacterium]